MAEEKKAAQHSQEIRQYSFRNDLHSLIINTANKLGYPINEDGTCFGIVQMAIQARLSNTFDIFLARLEYISKTSAETIKTHLSSAQTKKKNPLNEEETQAMDVAAFLEGIYILQQPNALKEVNKAEHDNIINTSQYLGSKKDIKQILSSQNVNAPLTLNLVESIAMKKSGGVIHHKKGSSLSLSNRYTKNTLLEFFARLTTAFQHLQHPVALHLDFTLQFMTKASGHAIAIIYEPDLRVWRFIDPNYLYLANTPYNNKELTDVIMEKLDITLSKEHAFSKRIFSKLSMEQTVLFEVSEIIGGKTQSPDITKKAVNDFYKMQFAHPLLFAAYFNQLDDVEKLLSAGADPNMRNHDGQTLLMFAITNNNMPLAKLLLKKGANPNPDFVQVVVSGSPQLLQAVTESQKFRSALLNAPFKYNACTFSNPLSYVIRHVTVMNILEKNNSNDLIKKPIVSMLLRAGANPNATDRQGSTHLTQAVKAGLTEITKVLLSFGGNPNQKNKEGDTLLLTALKAKNPAIVEALLDAKANPNTPGADGISPLYFAVANEDIEIIKALLKAGATPTAACKEMAALSDKEEIKEIFNTTPEERKAAEGQSSYASALDRLQVSQKPENNKKAGNPSSTSMPTPLLNDTETQPTPDIPQSSQNSPLFSAAPANPPPPSPIQGSAMGLN